MRYRERPIEAITFNEFVAYGLRNTTNIVNGMPWSFNYYGYACSHEDDDRYIICSPRGSFQFTAKDMLVTGIDGAIYPLRKDIFDMTYELVL